MATFGSLITRTLTRLRAQGGLDVNVYAQPVIAEILQHKFDVVFDKRFWRVYTTRETFTLDGTTGKVTADVSTKIKRFADIKAIWPDGYRNPIPTLDRSIPTRYVNLTCFGENNEAAKVFTVYPITMTGTVEVVYRTKPAAFTESDEVKLDDQLMILGACYDYLLDEAADQTNAQKFLGMYRDRLNTLEALEDHGSHSFYTQSMETAFQWRDA